MPNRSILFLVALLVALGGAACSRSGPPSKLAVPPASGGAVAPEASGSATAGDEGTARGGQGWHKTGVTEAQSLADSDACYRFAQAQIAKDMRIDRDIDAARGDRNSFFARADSLDRRVDSYYYGKERVARFESCMKAKGYIRY